MVRDVSAALDMTEEGRNKTGVHHKQVASEDERLSPLPRVFQKRTRKCSQLRTFARISLDQSCHLQPFKINNDSDEVPVTRAACDRSTRTVHPYRS
jgi:hypothetical protein